MYPTPLAAQLSSPPPEGGSTTPPPIVSRFGLIPARQQAILLWNPPRVRPILGVITQVYDTNKRVALTDAL